tara:strand:- start:214 stop:468 length:255 start_codon:yes stop_codon:yes gene_type:complete
MSNEKKSYNIVPGIDDMEYVEMYNLDPALAYTPEINEAILSKVWDNNYAGAVAEGLSEEEAMSHAEAQRESGRMTVAAATKDEQ